MSKEKIKIVIVGCGGFCSYNLPYIIKNKRFEIVGLVDNNKDRLIEKNKIFKLPEDRLFFSDFDAYKKINADLAIIFTPVEKHYQNCLNALESGCNISCAKPFVDKIEEAVKLINISRKKKLWISVGQQARLGTFARIMREIVRKNRIGKIAFANKYTYRDRTNILEYQKKEDWPVINATSIHDFDMYRYIFNCNIKKVCFRGIDAIWDPYKDPGVITGWIEMESGIVISYFQSFISKFRIDDSKQPYEHIYIQGEKGAIFMEGAWGRGSIILKKVDSKKEKILYNGKDDSEKVFNLFYKLLENTFFERKEVFCPSDDNIFSLISIKAAVESAKNKGMIINVQDFAKRFGLGK